jgi:hypothetical protein
MNIRPLLVFTEFLGRLGPWVLVGIASVALAISVLTASFVENRTAALLLAIMASLAAGFVYALTIPRTLASHTAGQEEKFRAMKEKLRETANEQRNLEAEIARYQSMHLNVDAYKPILRLNLLSVRTKIRDFLHTPVQAERISLEGGFLGIRKKEHVHKSELLNVIRAEFDANLGVDLAKLKFHEYQPGKVRVTGFRHEFQGIQNLTVAKELSLRIDTQTKLESGELVREQVLWNDGTAAKKGDEMQADILRRLNSGTEFTHLDEGVLKMTRTFLEVIFSPLGVSLEFDSTGTAVGLPFVDFLESKNGEADARIGELKARRRELLNK